MELDPISSPVIWENLFEGDWKQGWMHSGIGSLSDGRIVFEAPGGGALLYLDSRTCEYERVKVDVAVSHGIFVTHNAEGDQIWMCDPGVQAPGQAVLIDLDGTIVRKVEQPLRNVDESGKWRPTSVTVAANGDIWIADGYGLSLIHVFHRDGSSQTFDGASSGIKFDCPHGITIDARGPQPLVAVADRSNKRIVFLEQNGEFVREVTADIMTSPSSIATRGDLLLVTDLFGAILVVDNDDQVRAIVPTSNTDSREGWPNAIISGDLVGPEVTSGKANSPHGITVTGDGGIFFTEWYLGGRVVQIS